MQNDVKMIKLTVDDWWWRFMSKTHEFTFPNPLYECLSAMTTEEASPPMLLFLESVAKCTYYFNVISIMLSHIFRLSSAKVLHTAFLRHFAFFCLSVSLSLSVRFFLFIHPPFFEVASSGVSMAFASFVCVCVCVCVCACLCVCVCVFFE